MSMLLRRAMMSAIAGSQYDPYFEQVLSLTSFEGTNGATSFADLISPGGGTFTGASSATISTANSKTGAASSRFANISSVFTSANSVLITSGTDFTAEAWVYLDATTSTQVIWQHGNYAAQGYELYAISGGALYCHGNGASILGTGVGVISAATWTHCAVTRTAGVWRIWVNGVVQATSSVNNLTLTGVMYFGIAGVGLIGNIDTWRYTANVARYTTTFTPSTVEFPNSSNQAYATWNPSDKTNATLTLGNLKIAATTGGTAVGARATVGKSTGKHYWEVTRGASGSGTEYIGISTSGAALTSAPAGALVITTGGVIYNDGGFGGSVTAPSLNDVIGFALDADAKTLKVYVNNVLQGTYTYTFSNPVYPRWACADNGSGNSATANFGATPFKYTIPAGFNPGLF